jgi:hypothetical protein
MICTLPVNRLGGPGVRVVTMRVTSGGDSTALESQRGCGSDHPGSALLGGGIPGPRSARETHSTEAFRTSGVI